MNLTFWNRQKQLKNDYKAVFDTDAGARVLNDLMQRSFVFGTTAEGDIRLNEGRRAIVLHILQQLEISPHQYRKLYGESVDEYLETVGVDNG